MNDKNYIGMYAGRKGLDRLLIEINRIIGGRKRVIIAITGIPGCGKTHIVKNFTRFGFGNFSKRDIKIIDDNIIYSTKLWRLHWEKIEIEKRIWKEFVQTLDFKVLFFSNWIPSRFIDFADIVINVTSKEEERIARLKKRYRKRPDKISIQKGKTTVPIELPFECNAIMLFSDPNNEVRLWSISWMLKRLFYSYSGRHRAY